jgi:hypothetical protein
MDASKLKEAVRDRYRPALGRVLLLVSVLLLELGLRIAAAAGCIQISE